jgi:hypothetical protein
MQTATTSHHQSSTAFENPIDDQLYDILQALVSKAEALEAYAKYEQDADDQDRQLFQTLGRDDAEHARRLLDALKRRLGQS